MRDSAVRFSRNALRRSDACCSRCSGVSTSALPPRRSRSREAAAARRDEALRAGEAKLHRGDASAADVVADRRWLARLDETVKAAEQALAAAAGRVAAAQGAEADARETLAQATRDLQAVEKHRESWLAEERRAEERRAEALLDDLAPRKG